MGGSLEQIVGEALELPKPQRPSFLERACGGDTALQREAESLVEAFDNAGEFLANPSELPIGPDGAAEAPVGHVGAVVGAYRLLERIGEGGFGTVYMAEQHAPVQRRVALKVVKPGMDSKQVIARFEAERQALAMMDHPNIARVLEAGATDAQSPLGPGRPYFVMELVRGVPITKFCDENNLTIRQRLELAIDVCHAVQHAHMKGVIHRDLKPSNVLVSLHDERPVVKVIDFGVAKATQGRLTEKTLFTEFRQLIGTPAYMSPEQAQMSGIDVDTRSDIYSLGVLLYELLTGTTPFDAKTLLDSGYDEMRRIIREVEPPRPSTRLSSFSGKGTKARKHEGTKGNDSGAASLAGAGFSDSSSADVIAGHRRTDAPTLRRQLRGELDWIVMKCLEKDRTRRYETANGLAADIAHRLAGEPVHAAPPSKFYWLSKVLRRYRVPVSIAGGFVFLILCCTVVSTVFWQRAEREAATARDEAEKAAQTSAFLERMLASINPEQARGREVSVREVLDSAARTIEGQFRDRPRVEAGIRVTLGNSYRGLGNFEAAEAQLRPALEIVQREFGNEHPDTLKTANDLAGVLQSRGQYAEAEVIFERTLASRRRVLGNEHEDTLRSMNNLGMFYWDRARYAEAEALLTNASQAAQRRLGEEHDLTATALNNLALVTQALGRNSEAEQLFLRVLRTRERLDPQGLAVIDVLDNLAALYVRLERFADAEPLQRTVLELSQRVYGPEHPATLVAMSNLGTSYGSQGRLSESFPLAERVLSISRRVLGDHHPQTLKGMANLGAEHAAIGRLDEAVSLSTEALDGQRRVLGSRHTDTLITINNLALCNRRLGRFDKAETLYREALEAQTEMFGEEHLETLRSMHNLAVVYREAKRYDDADALAVRALTKLRSVLGNEHTLTLSATVNLALLRDLQGRPDEAEPLFLESVSTGRRVLPETHEYRLGWLNNLTNFLRVRRRFAEAEPLLHESLELSRKQLGDEHAQVAMHQHHWAEALREVGRLDEAVSAAREAHEMYRAHPDWPAHEARHSRSVLIAICNARGEWEQSIALAREALDEAPENRRMNESVLAAVLVGYGQQLIERARDVDAESPLAEALKLRTALFPDGHELAYLRHNATSLLGSALAGQGRFAEAERLLIDGYEGMKADPRDPPPTSVIQRRREALERIVKLYEAWEAAEPGTGRLERAAKYRARMDDAPEPPSP